MTWAFIMGPARTSTSVLAYALSLHPQCLILHESGFPHLFFNAANGGPPAEIIYHRYNGQQWERDSIFKWSGGIDQTPRDACFFLRDTFPPVQVFGDKLPGAILHWRLIRDMLPESKIIVTQRDRNDIIVSHEGRASRDPEFAKLFADQGVQHIDDALSASVEVLKRPNTIGIQHDDIQGSPRETISVVLDFLGLSMDGYPFDEMMGCFEPGVRIY